MISVVINTLNEEAHIEECIKSVRCLADEILVCDMFSDDETVEKAKALGARIIYHKRERIVEPARFFAVSNAINDWVLVLDADERISEKLSQKLRQIASRNEFDLVRIDFLYNYFGDYVRNGGFLVEKLPRFFKKEQYVKTYTVTDETVHGNFQSLSRNTKNALNLGKEFYVIHEAYPKVTKFVTKTIGHYAEVEAEAMMRDSQKFQLTRMLSDTVKTFLRKFILKKGYRDGTRGFILCVLYSVFRFAVWSNLWLLEQEQIKKNDTLHC